MKKIAYLTGTRAEFGLMQGILKKIESQPAFKLLLMATGMHLLPEFGQTIDEVKAEFPELKIIDATYKDDNRLSMARFLGKCCQLVTETLQQEKPDLVLVLGDRAEQLAMAQTAAYLAIPVIHLHGGEHTTTVDNKARNAIAMLADYHLPATKKSAEKLMTMGIEPNKIQVVGAPGLDEINNLGKSEKKEFLVVLQHPDEDEHNAAEQMQTTLKAFLSFNLPVKIIYPNSDPGGREIIKVILEYVKKYPDRLEAFPNLTHEAYLKLLSQAKVLIGNSSSALIEAPSLGLMAVNIGPRQKGREKAENVIDADYEEKSIIQAIKLALEKKFDRNDNPYGDGQTSERVLAFLNQKF